MSSTMPQDARITAHLVSSLDGFIAKADGDTSWMHTEEHYSSGKKLTEEEVAAFLDSIDCYIMGSKTYEQALAIGWPYGDTPVVVLTNRELPIDKASVSFYSGNLNQLVNHQLKPTYHNIWVVGGAMVIKSFLHAQLADELVLSIMPVILGNGLAFFDETVTTQKLALKDVIGYQNGMVELTYTIKPHLV